MKVKKVTIGIKSVKDVSDNFVKTDGTQEKGGRVKKEREISFDSIKGFRKAITPKRIELLHVIKEKQPKSIQELTRLAKRDVKSVVTDIGILEELGFLDIRRKKGGRKESMPVVNYHKINLEIVV